MERAGGNPVIGRWRPLPGLWKGRSPAEILRSAALSPLSAIPKLASLPGKGTGPAAALLLCTAASFLVFCPVGWAEVVSPQAWPFDLFHHSREIASCYSPGVSQGRGEQNHLSRSIPSASRADPLLDFLLR